MKTKNKIALSIGILLVVIVSLGFFTSQSTQIMKLNTENILKDNYNSVDYAQKMIFAVNSFYKDSVSASNLFLENLKLQEHNVTEREERMVTSQLRNDFMQFRHRPDKDNKIRLDETINHLIKLNTDAICQKSGKAVSDARDALIWTIVLSIASALIAIFMLIKFPKILTSPIKELLAGIVEISNHNYDKRLNFGPRSEFNEMASSFNNMAQELSQFQKSSMARVISTKQYLETVINAIKEPILGLDNEKSILFANQALTQIINLPAAEIIHKSALDISLSNDLLRRLIRGLESKKEEDNNSLKIYSDNKECYYDVHYLHLPEKSGTVIMLSDVTKFRMLDNAKTNFISIISHELKTPIAAIMMSLKLLEDNRVGEMNDEQKSLAQGIQENSERLLNITSELLKMTQVETGSLQLNPKITKPIELIDYAIGATRILAERFRCNIEVEYPETKMPKLFVDSEKIAWVVTNLLSNAIHYSPENSRIIIGAKHVGHNVEIFVRDFGKGIDPRYHDTIFERYFRVPGTKIQGSGLGLAISKDFVEAHGGNIRVDSEIGKGSCFTISFNVA
ncbi:MAG: HAMP domain-containing protein [Bacteroidales bacterium]|nr:HAMP domain-containing protein [Bacteroidales bacterium]